MCPRCPKTDRCTAWVNHRFYRCILQCIIGRYLPFKCTAVASNNPTEAGEVVMLLSGNRIKLEIFRFSVPSFPHNLLSIHGQFRVVQGAWNHVNHNLCCLCTWWEQTNVSLNIVILCLVLFSLHSSPSLIAVAIYTGAGGAFSLPCCHGINDKCAACIWKVCRGVTYMQCLWL